MHPHVQAHMQCFHQKFPDIHQLQVSLSLCLILFSYVIPDN